MRSSAEITLHLQNAGDILLEPASPAFCKRSLNEFADEFIIEEATKLPKRGPIYLTVYLPAPEMKRSGEVEKAIHDHFAYKRKKAKEKLGKTLRLGWRSLLIGFAFLVIMYLVIQLLLPRIPAGGFVITVRELLIILSWVALWRPAELLLYEWYPYRADAILFQRLEKSQLKFVEQIG